GRDDDGADHDFARGRSGHDRDGLPAPSRGLSPRRRGDHRQPRRRARRGSGGAGARVRATALLSRRGVARGLALEGRRQYGAERKAGRAGGRRARRTRGRVLAFAGIVVAGGAAVAATKLDLVPWLKTKSNSNIRFSIDPHRRYRGPAPAEVRCPGARSAVFTCRPVAVLDGTRLASPHTYRLAERIQAQPRLTRTYVLTQLDAAEERGAVPPLLARRIRLDAEAVSNDFFAKLNVVASVQSIGTGPVEVEPGPGRRAVVLLPPKDQPVIVACSSSASSGLT